MVKKMTSAQCGAMIALALIPMEQPKDSNPDPRNSRTRGSLEISGGSVIKREKRGKKIILLSVIHPPSLITRKHAMHATNHEEQPRKGMGGGWVQIKADLLRHWIIMGWQFALLML